jgi:hypothetical protein
MPSKTSKKKPAVALPNLPPLSCCCCLRNTCLQPRDNLISLEPLNLTSRLPSRRGDIAIELRCVHINLRLYGAGEGNRTLVLSLGSFSSAIELHPL